MRFLTTVALSLAMSGRMAAQEGVEFERVLLPVTIPLSIYGAFGAEWTTDLWVRNDAGVPVYMNPYDYGCRLATCGPAPRVPSGTAFQPQGVGPVADTGIPGLFFQIERPHADQVDIALRVRDLSRQSDGWGTELPVVPEAAFKSEKLTLLDVPNFSGFRVLLRVYGIAEIANPTVTVTTLRLNENALFFGGPPQEAARQTLTMRSGPESVWRYVPHYAEVDLTSQGAVGRMLVEITPDTPGLRIWAFATVTQNDTQHVTIVSPR